MGQKESICSSSKCSNMASPLETSFNSAEEAKTSPLKKLSKYKTYIDIS